MKANMILKALVIASIAAGVGACASHPAPNTFNQAEAGRAQTVEWGTVSALREVTIQTDGSGVATATGAVLGGVAGSTIGGGTRSSIAGATAGAAAGGAIGSAASGSTRPGVEVTVDLDSGGTIAVVQDGSVNEFRVGDRVRVASDGVTTRVSR